MRMRERRIHADDTGQSQLQASPSVRVSVAVAPAAAPPRALAARGRDRIVRARLSHVAAAFANNARHRRVDRAGEID